MTTQPIFCPQCGTKRTEGLSFCGSCGYEFGAAAPEAAKPVAPVRQRPSLARVIVTPIVLMVVGYLWFGLLGIAGAAAIGALWILIATSR